MKPWFLLPPQWAHDLGPLALKVYSKIFGCKETPKWKSVTWRNLFFANPLGIAGGVDKNAENMLEWWQLGVGFLEIGTVTPRPQDPNPGKIMDRDLSQKALWNKMGFPSMGSEKVFLNMEKILQDMPQDGETKKIRTPIFINIGKNRDTSNENAVTDYLAVMEKFKSLGDAFVINISSPNTKGLRDLQSSEYLEKFLAELVQKSKTAYHKPLILKLSPDMGQEQFRDTIEICAKLEVDGLILTNTTLQRQVGMKFPLEGGVSGAPLQQLSIKTLVDALQILGDRRKNMLIISAGGVITTKDIEQRLHLGADLVQIYSGLIFEGPGFFLKAAKVHERH